MDNPGLAHQHREKVLPSKREDYKHFTIIQTRWMGNKVLIAPSWITGVNWAGETVSVDLSQAAVKASPQYNSNELLDRNWELQLHKHYGRTGYWAPAEEVDAHY